MSALNVIALLVTLSLLLSHAVADLPIRVLRPNTLYSPFGATFEPSTGNVLIAQSGTASIVRMNTAGVILSNINPGYTTTAITADSAGILYAVTTNIVFKFSALNGTRFGTWTVSGANGIAVDSKFMYITTTSNSIQVYTLMGTLQRTIPTGATNVIGIALDSAGNIYVGSTGGVVKFNNQGTRQAVFSTTAPAMTSVLGVAVDFIGNVYASDYTNSRVVRFNSAGIVTATYNSSSPGMTYPRGMAIEPSTGQLYVVDQSAASVFVYETFILYCNAGANGRYTDLSKISPNGADLQGLNADRTTLYSWSVCGNMQNLYCIKYATNASVCGMTIPISKVNTIALSTPSLPWQPINFVPDGQQQPVTGLSAVTVNGDRCGRFGLPSELITLLVCATAQDATLDIDDSLVSPTSTICLYIMTLHTPAVCPETVVETPRLSTQSARTFAKAILGDRQDSDARPVE